MYKYFIIWLLKIKIIKNKNKQNIIIIFYVNNLKRILIDINMGRPSRNFKPTNNKKKYTPKQKYDHNKYKEKRIIGYLYDNTPIIGSKSELIKPLNSSMAPYELYDKKENEYIKREMFLFKKYMSNSDISVW